MFQKFNIYLMRSLFTVVFLMTFNWSFTQDTVFHDKDMIIYFNKKVVQKEFFSSTNYIKIVYQYNELGVLVRRFWYNKDGELVSCTLDN